MKKAIRIFAIVLGVLVALGALVLLGLNLYVRRPGTQSQIEEKAGRSLGMPLKITGASLTPWGGLQLKSARIPQTNPDAGTGDFLEASECIVRFKLLPLFSGRLEITSVNIAEPKLIWMQNDRGKWRLPSVAKTGPKTDAPKTDQGLTKRKLDFAIDHLRVERGAFDFLDSKHRRVGSFAGLEIDAPSITADSASGTVRSAATSIADFVFPKNLRASVAYRDGQLTMSNIEAEVVGGHVAGDFKIETGKADSPYTADMRMEGVDVDRLVVESGGQPGQITGTLSGWLDLYGTTRNTDVLGGSGRFLLRDGRVRGNEILQVIGQVLQIEELTRLDLHEGQADFHIGDGKVWIDPLVLQSPNLKLTVRGTIRLEDQKITAEARLEVNQKISEKIPDIIGKQMTRTENGDGGYIDFGIKGTLNKPKTDLAERLIGDALQKQVADFLSNFGGKKKDKDEKKKPKKKDQPEPVPQPPVDPGVEPEIK